MKSTEIERLANGLVIHEQLEYECSSFTATQERFLVDDPTRVAVQGPSKIVFENGSYYIYGAFITLRSSNLINLINKISTLRRVKENAIKAVMGLKSDVSLIITQDSLKLSGYTLPELIQELISSSKTEKIEINENDISFDSETDDD